MRRDPLRLRIVEGRDAGQEIELDGPVVVGRSSARATLVIRDPETSRRHASLIPEGQALNVQDLGSTNGTFVNGERIEDRHVAVPGDRITMGTTVLEVALAPGAEAQEPEPAAPAQE